MTWNMTFSVFEKKGQVQSCTKLAGEILSAEELMKTICWWLQQGLIVWFLS